MHMYNNDGDREFVHAHDEQELSVRRIATRIQVSDRLLADMMADYWHETMNDVEDNSEPWLTRARRRMSRKVVAVRMRLGSWVAGVDLDTE